MKIEYMEAKSKKEAEEFLSEYAKLELDEKHKVYIQKENDQLKVLLKVNKKKKIKSYNLELGENALYVRCENHKEYMMEIVCAILFLMLCIGFFVCAMLLPTWRMIFAWSGLFFLFLFMFYTWKKWLKPNISLKIFLIRLL